MEISKTDYLKKNSKIFKKNIQLQYYHADTVKKLVVNGSITNFLLAANIEEKIFVKTVIN